MPSKKIPKLVVRQATTSRKLKPAQEGALEDREGRSRKITRTTVAVKRAKKSLHNNAALIIVALCAAVVSYGIAASVTATEAQIPNKNVTANVRSEVTEVERPGQVGYRPTSWSRKPATGSDPVRPAPVGKFIKREKHRSEKDPSIIIFIDHYEDGTVIKKYKEIKRKDPAGSMLYPLEEYEAEKSKLPTPPEQPGTGEKIPWGYEPE